MIPGSLGHATIRKTRGLHWHNTKSNQIEQSMWLDGSSQDLSRSSFTLSSDGQKELIVSIWVKRLEMGRAQEVWILGNSSGIASYNDNIHANFNADDTLNFSIGNGGSSGGQIKPTRVFRDIGWYHLLFSFNSNTSIVNNLERLHLYVNGERQTDLATNTAVPDNQDVRGSLTGSADFRFGRNTHPSLNYFHKAYMAQACYLEGKSIQAGDYAVSDFLDTWAFGNNGTQFVPKKTSDIASIASTVGGNSFCLDFADSSTFGNDISSNNNDLSDAGSPGAANQSGNTPSHEFPILSPIDGDATAVASLGYGGKLAVGVSDWDSIFATKSMGSSGKYYYETRVHTETASNGFPSGIHDATTTGRNYASFIGNTTSTYGLGYSLYSTGSGSGYYTNGSPTSITGYSSALSAGDIISTAVDLDNNKIWWGLNGTYFDSGNPSTNTGGIAIQADTEYTFGVSPSASEDYFVNFGDDSTFGGAITANTNSDTNNVGAFKYAVPTNFQCLSTKSLSGPDYQGIDYFDSTLYEGTGGGQRVGDFVPFTDAYNVSKSIIFNDDDSAYLNRTPASDGDKQKMTFSWWMKRGNLGITDCRIFTARDSNDDQINFRDASDYNRLDVFFDGTSGGRLTTNRIFKDTSQWVHCVVAIDTTQSSAGDRVRIYINGVEETSFATETQPTLNKSLNGFNNDGAHAIGARAWSGAAGFYDGYLAEIVFIDGAQLTPSSFGQTDTSTNRWVPKDVSGLTFGTNGYYLDMAIAPGTGNGPGNDVSGNNNDFTVNNFAATDQSNDTPSNNHATLDSADTIGSATPTLSEGNTKFVGADNGGRYVSGFPMTTGKYYWELEVTTAGAFYPGFFTPAGVAFASATPWNNNAGSFLVSPGPSGGHWLGADGDGTKILYGVESGASPQGGPGRFIADGDRMFFAFDADNKYAYVGEVGSGGSGSSLTYYGRNGSVTGDPTSGEAGTGAAPFGLNLTGEDTFYFGAVAGGSSNAVNFLFDSTKWNGTPPTGYVALTQDNLNAADDKITAWAWIKNRDATDNHILVDRVRGIGKDLHSNADTGSGLAPAEVTNPNTVQRFLQRGVEIGSDAEVNTVNESYVLWQWLVGTSASTGTTTSPAGTIASTSIVADAGHFAIISYTGNATSGATIGHGMSGAPEMIWVKERDNANGWIVSTPDIGFNKVVRIDTGDPEGVDTGAFNSTAPSSTLITLGSNNGTNRSSGAMICYAFRSIPGVCKIGIYTGNGAADGPYISLGFKPAWVLTKNITDTEHWILQDNVREPFNLNDEYLSPSQNIAAATGLYVDLLSDGFKVRSTSNMTNGSGDEMIYLAMAEIGGNAAYPPIYGR
jgi:hypothetical protein